MSSADVARLVDTASASLKTDLKGAIAKLEEAHGMALRESDSELVALVCEELARAWARRKSPSRSLYYAIRATKVAPERKTAWTTLAKTCELIATRIAAPQKQARASALYRAAGAAFKRAAGMTKDPEDKRWLLELASDAVRASKPRP